MPSKYAEDGDTHMGCGCLMGCGARGEERPAGRSGQTFARAEELQTLIALIDNARARARRGPDKEQDLHPARKPGARCLLSLTCALLILQVLEL